MNNIGDRLRRHVHALTPERPASFPEVLMRRDRRRRRRRVVVAGGTASVAVAAVTIVTQLLGPNTPGEGPDPAQARDSHSPVISPSPTNTQRPQPTYEWSEDPSPVVLRLEDRDLELKPWSYCWEGPPNRKGISPGICADGYAQTPDLDNVGSPGFVGFWFGVENWDFQATFTELGDNCRRQHTVGAVPTGDQMFRLDPAGLAGRYRVDLFGRGRHGSASASFLWTTPADGPTDQPTAYIALISGDSDELTAHQLEVGVQDLAFQPREADVDVTVTAANGRSMTLDAEPEHTGACYAEGSLFFRGGADPAQEAAQLGSPPFSYDVQLTLDGKRYRGTAVWPRDEMSDEAPNTVLTFDPPLPSNAAG